MLRFSLMKDCQESVWQSSIWLEELRLCHPGCSSSWGSKGLHSAVQRLETSSWAVHYTGKTLPKHRSAVQSYIQHWRRIGIYPRIKGNFGPCPYTPHKVAHDASLQVMSVAPSLLPLNLAPYQLLLIAISEHSVLPSFLNSIGFFAHTLFTRLVKYA